ncbi:MAG: septum formation protein Maf [Acidimicrobiaceae bacterium]|jgi:septum formation protein|nr:septum formation protein Maf [Acidimicrobiaceae bacterium]MBT5581299.1 septum formation protein Maf [Acidimicrobiaceae bacterium]MBT5850811.1 septum formation protein Maf [Acidimicrobiaceae bacterium]
MLDSSSPLTLVLASGSPRRRELLERLGIVPLIEPADLDESVRPGEQPAAYVERLAREKAATALRSGVVVIAADTAVVRDNEILGKPTDQSDTIRMLTSMSGRSHQAVTGVTVSLVELGEPRIVAGVETTIVSMEELSAERIAWYADSGEPDDKAGAYGLQGAASLFADRIEGSVTNVIGLPLALLDELFVELDLNLLDFRRDT